MGKDVELDDKVEEVIGSGETTLDESRLIDVTEVAKKAGFIYPVKVSRSLYDRCLTIRSEDADKTDEDGLWMFCFSLQRHDGAPPESFRNRWRCTFIMNEGRYLGRIKVVRRGETEAERALTFMLPED